MLAFVFASNDAVNLCAVLVWAVSSIPRLASRANVALTSDQRQSSTLPSREPVWIENNLQATADGRRSPRNVRPSWSLAITPEIRDDHRAPREQSEQTDLAGNPLWYGTSAGSIRLCGLFVQVCVAFAPVVA
jgi:hypothetical protein